MDSTQYEHSRCYLKYCSQKLLKDLALLRQLKIRDRVLICNFTIKLEKGKNSKIQ